MIPRLFSAALFACAAGLAIPLASASDARPAESAPAKSRKVSFSPALKESAPALPTGGALVFSAPPRESAEEAQRLYQPVADYLSRVLRRKVTYVHPRSELSYQKEMAKGGYDIVFGDAHFTSWRIAHLNHDTLARLAGRQVSVVVTRRDEGRIAGVRQLAGQRVCATGTADLAALTLLSEFEPMRQPLILEQVGWDNVIEGVISGRCTAGALPLAVLHKLDPGGTRTRVLHQSRALPNQTFSAGPRVSAEEQQALAAALVASEARSVLAPLLAANGSDAGLALASRDEYVGMDDYLKNIWGYAR